MKQAAFFHVLRNNKSRFSGLLTKFFNHSVGTFSKLFLLSLICWTTTHSANATVNLELSFNDSLTTPALHPPYISGTIGDANDPAATLGFYINVRSDKNLLPAAEYNAEADLKETLLPKESVQLTKKDGLLWVKIIADKPGISSLKIDVTYKGYSESIAITFAASVNGKQGGAWHTGMSDASAAVGLGNDYMLVADDELNIINVYDYKHSGLPLQTFNYADKLNLQDKKDGEFREIDCEAAARSFRNSKKTYWLGSMSNGGRDFEEQVNRSAVFSTMINGAGEAMSISYSNNYPDLRKELIKWGNRHGYKLAASGKFGQTPKAINGFNAEGACFAPDSNTLYIGFRAPLVPADARTKALIAPVENFETWFNNGKPTSAINIGEPIELELGGRGVRDIFALPNKKYIIIAGGCDTSHVTALFVWSGTRNDLPVELSAIHIADVPAEGGLPIIRNGVFENKIALVTDSGALDYYATRNANKNLHPNLRKFNTIIVTLPDSPLPNQ